MSIKQQDIAVLINDRPPEARPAGRRRGGRPSRAIAAQMRDRILDVATDLFLARGYGSTSVEAVAAAAQISKRTFYHRFHDKPDLFEAVVHRLLERWLPPFNARLVEGGTLEEVLKRLADQVLALALSPEALALHRVIVAEAQRFPELGTALQSQGAGRGVDGIAVLLERAARPAGHAIGDGPFAAAQFLQLVLAVPQRRALGLGAPLNQAELDEWARRSVELFLYGCWGKPD